MESYEMAKLHFEKLGASPEGQQELCKFNEVMQFNVKDDESFYIEIKGGKATVTNGVSTADPKKVISLTLDKATVREIFQKGQLYPGLADFMFSGKLWLKAPKTGDKPSTAWAAKLLRMHV